FLVRGRGYYDAGGSIGRGHVLNMTGNRHDIGEAIAFDAALYFGQIRVTALRVSREHRTKRSAAVPHHSRQRLDENQLPLPARDAAGQQDNSLGIVNAPALAQPLDTVARNARGIETIEIEAARDHHQSLRPKR